MTNASKSSLHRGSPVVPVTFYLLSARVSLANPILSSHAISDTTAGAILWVSNINSTDIGSYQYSTEVIKVIAHTLDSG